MLPLRDTELSKSLSARLLRLAEGLSSSTKLAVGGVLWLVLSLIFSCWVGWGMQDLPLRQQPTNSAASAASSDLAVRLSPPFGLAASHAVGQRFDKTFALQLVDTLIAHTLPMALPQAGWQRVMLPQYGEEGGPQGEASGGLPSAQCSPVATVVEDVRHFSVSGPCAPLRLGLALLDGLQALRGDLEVAGARAEVRWSPKGTLEVLLNDLVYYVVSFPGHMGQLADLAQPLPQAALAIVLDDMGQRTDAADEAAALPFAVTFAIWPRAPHAREVAQTAATRRLDCLLHQPMEALPRADHRRPDPGPGALLTGMSAEEMRVVLHDNLRALPTVIGLNNHMGSAFTGDISLCRTLAGMLGGQGLAVLDSVTRSDPQLAAAARDAGLVALARDVFLDTRRDTAAILVALDVAAARARAQGMAVAIGHPYAETLRALREWQDRDGAAVVPLRRIIWKLAQDKAAVAARPYSRNNNMEKE